MKNRKINVMIEEHFLTGLSFAFSLPILLLLSPGYIGTLPLPEINNNRSSWGGGGCKSKIVFCMWHCCCNFTTSWWQKLIPTQWRLPHGTAPPPPPPTPHYITVFMGNRESNSSLIKICKLSKTILTTLAPFQHGYRSSVLILHRSFSNDYNLVFTSSKNSYSLSLIFLSVCHIVVPEDFSGSYTWSRGLKIFCTFFKPRIIYAIRVISRRRQC